MGDTTFNKMQLLKRRFFAMRNGAVADSLRRQGADYRIIFGLNLPQLVDIAREFGPDIDLARQLRDNVATRESMLVAPMLFPVEELTLEEADKWLSGCVSTEVIDIACLKLFKYHPEAVQLVELQVAADHSLAMYAALRLSANLLPANMDYTEKIARAELERNNRLTQSMSRMILDDIEWRKVDINTR